MENVLTLLKKHQDWRKNCLNLIASENAMSDFAQKLYVTDLMHRYAEGLPFKRYYQGLKYVDLIEDEVSKSFASHFQANFVDIRPISGTSANLAVFAALSDRGDKILTLGIQGGSHVSHEEPGAAGLLGLQVFHLAFDQQELALDLNKVEQQIMEIRPKFVVLGGSVILFPQPVREIKEMCQRVGALLIYDAAHVFGLITAGFFQNPLAEGADIITSSSHKTFPGPQGGIILGNIDEELQKKIRWKVFPGVLSNHHLHRIPALYLTLLEMQKFGKDYVAQILKNAKKLAEELYDYGFDVLGKRKGFTASHQIAVDVSKQGGGDIVAKELENVNIILNKNILPWDGANPKDPSGIRIGVQEMTRYGMKENEMKQIAKLMKETLLDKKNPDKMRKKATWLRRNFQKIKYCF
ncbi:serine hydroxymethyltransferase [Candidatus Parcubacteria bacterium]|nr:serine hydroxymethyltransferase [Candidatus Parcubacteria bacterium]